MNLANATNLDRKSRARSSVQCSVAGNLGRASPQPARHPGQKKSGLSPTHFSVLLRSALKAKPKDKFVCSIRIRRLPVYFNGSQPDWKQPLFPQ
jgi:hypothetical protein